MTDSTDLTALWNTILKNEISSRSIFHISSAEVRSEIQNPNDLDLFDIAIESIENEPGLEEWLITKPVAKSEGGSMLLASKTADAGKRPLCFLSKLPDGVFISGTTSKALSRLQADFTTYSVSCLRRFFFPDCLAPTHTPLTTYE
jgi:hypothetical protein